MDLNEFRSPSDQRNYHVFTLPNALEVLLIQDQKLTVVCQQEAETSSSDCSSENSAFNSEEEEEEEEEDGGVKAAACLTIGVGSFADPLHLQGLAHYLEHMVFMGSEKYPDENEFEAFLSANGGYSNGSTDCESTSFVFEVGPAHLQKALDMFAHFFVSPLLKKEAMDRELCAIDSEYNQALQSDAVRLQQVSCRAARKDHPYNKFSWGNKDSLKTQPEANGIDVHQHIYDFYKKYYSANLMKLVVYGKDSIEEMKGWVIESFGLIVNNNCPSPEYKKFGDPFSSHDDEGNGCRLFKVVPLKDMHSLHINWPLPALFDLYKEKPADCIGHLLGHEGEGSLFSLLKENGWASALEAGIVDTDGYESGSWGSIFDMNVKLTELGLSNWTEIVTLVFQFISLISNNSKSARVFEELKTLSEIAFRFQQESEPIVYVEELAAVMLKYEKASDRSNLLRVDMLQGSFDKELYNLFCQHFKVTNMRIFITSHDFQKEAAEQKWNVEKWFQAPFIEETVGLDLLQHWQKQSATTNSSLSFPQPNPFIPQDFSLKQLTNSSDSLASTSPWTSVVPTLIANHNSSLVKLWYKQDNMFGMPRANVCLLLKNGKIQKTARNFVLSQLFVKCLCHVLNEYAYQAAVAELGYQVQIRDNSIEIIFSGFNDKLLQLVKVVFDVFFTLPFNGVGSNSNCCKNMKAITEDVFAVFLEDLTRYYQNLNIRVTSKATYLRLLCLKQCSFLQSDCLSILTSKSISLKDMEDFLQNDLWPSFNNIGGDHSVEALIHGNLTQQEAQHIVNCVEEKYNQSLVNPSGDKTESNRLNIYNVYRLPEFCTVLMREKSDLLEEVNSLVESYYQFEKFCGASNMLELAYADLLEGVMTEPLFDTLRTKEQLGYSVHCSVRLTHGVLGFTITCQTSHFPTAFIQSRMDAFVQEFNQALIEMPERIYQAHLKALIEKKRERHNNLSEETHSHWYEIHSRRFQFHTNEILANLMQNGDVTKEGLIERYERWLLPKGSLFKRLNVHVVGRASANIQEEDEHSKTDESNNILCVDGVLKWRSSLVCFE